MEDRLQNTPNYKKPKHVLLNPKKFAVTIIGLLLLIGSYSLGYNSGKDQGIKEAKEASAHSADERLRSIPASGEVTSVSDSNIEIKLTGNETRKANVTKDTKVSDKTGAKQIGDVKVGSRVILYTEKDGDNYKAYRIVMR